MVIGDKVGDKNKVKHEYGHYLQLQEIGFAKYTYHVAIPSLEGYWNDVDNYYSQPWEYGADLLGGVDPNVRTYTSDAEENYRIYWDHITK